MTRKRMNSQEVRDLLMVSDSEEDMFDDGDDDSDPSYILSPNSISDDDQPSQKRRRCTVDPSHGCSSAHLTISLQNAHCLTNPAQTSPTLPSDDGPANPAQTSPTLPSDDGPANPAQTSPTLPSDGGPANTAQTPPQALPVRRKRLRNVGERNGRDTLLHQVKDGCTSTCKLECQKTFGDEDRVRINKEFWSLNPTERRQWVWGIVSQEMKKRLSTKGNSRRSMTYHYFLRRPLESGGGLKQVCKVFFLTTLGYNKSSDAAVMRILGGISLESPSPSPDKRGRHVPKNKLDHGEIRDHIMKYNPAVHHYRREHAPNRLYLPSDITIADMHANFCQTVRHISVETYRKVVRDLNISFAVLGAEECEVCKRFNAHTKETDVDDTQACECDLCTNYNKHKEKRDLARAAYQEDSKKAEQAGEIFTSVDLQKIMMLPRLPGIKSCAFTRRIVAFNETFAGLGRSSNNVAVIWNEAVSGRNADDICSTYWEYFKRERDARRITMWGDNCCAQNKNWTFFTFLAAAVNSNDIAAEEITFKYLEVGHTFMAADSVHHSIERELRKRGDVRDWQEYVETLENAKCKVVSLGSTDFKAWKDHSNRLTLSKSMHKLSEMVIVQFRRGYRTMFYKKAHREDAPYICADFLKKKADISIIPTDKNTFRGISSLKKQGILKNICPLMPKSRSLFWERLPVNDEAVDLINIF